MAAVAFPAFLLGFPLGPQPCALCRGNVSWLLDTLSLWPLPCHVAFNPVVLAGCPGSQDQLVRTTGESFMSL